MSSKCKDPNYILTTPECKTVDVDTYNNYISQMNLYCSKEDNAISNPNCIDYINNNKFIQTTDFNKDFKKSATDLCLKNLNPLYDTNCINSYKTKPLEFIRKEEVKIQIAKDAADKKAQAAADEEQKKMLMWVAIGVVIFILLASSGYLIYKKRKQNALNSIEEDRRDIENGRENGREDRRDIEI